MRADLLIVGAGPAGLAAAETARTLGLTVICLDEQPAPGGQVWRGVEAAAATPRAAALGRSYRGGLDVVAAFRACGAVYEPGAQLWQLEIGATVPSFTAFASRDGRAWAIEADTVLLATGAQERPVPFPGWTLPGVMTVGAAQILLKGSGQVPDAPVSIAGSGPLPLLYARQLLKLGGRIAAFLDTTPPGQALFALRRLRPGRAALWDMAQGLGWKAQLHLSRVPV